MQDISPERLVRGRGVDAVGIEALIQHGALEHGLAVEHELHALQPHAAHAEVAVHMVVAVGQLQIVQAAAAQLPPVKLAQRQMHLNRAAPGLHGRFAHDAALVFGGELQLRCAGQHRGHAQCALLQRRNVLDLFYMRSGHELHPHGLPDARGAGVHASIGAVVLALLARGNQAVALVVLGADGDDVFACMHQLGHVKGEGDVAAGVPAGADAVDERLAAIVHRAEMQHHAARSLRVRQADRELRVAHAGEGALGAEGHGDFARQGCAGLAQSARAAAAAVVDFKFPLAVQVQPRIAAELRLGMFASRNAHFATLLACAPTGALDFSPLL